MTRAATAAVAPVPMSIWAVSAAGTHTGRADVTEGVTDGMTAAATVTNGRAAGVADTMLSTRTAMRGRQGGNAAAMRGVRRAAMLPGINRSSSSIGAVGG